MKMLAILLLLPVVSSAQTLTVDVPNVPINGAIVVRVTEAIGPGNWVGLYVPGAADGYYLTWQYLNGQQWAPAAPVQNAVLSFTAPAAMGSYEVRLYTPLRAATVPITVGGGGVVNQGRVVFNGDSITAVSYMPNPQNWAAIVGTRLGYQTIVNLATAGKYAAGVLDEVGGMSGSLCVVMIGANDMAAAVEHDTHAEDAKAAYLYRMRMIVAALKASCAKVAILSPALTLMPREVMRYGAWTSGLRALCAEFGVTFLDLWRYMVDRSAVSTSAVVNSWYAVPGVDFYHLSAAGHSLIADFVVQSGQLTP